MTVLVHGVGCQTAWEAPDLHKRPATPVPHGPAPTRRRVLRCHSGSARGLLNQPVQSFDVDRFVGATDFVRTSRASGPRLPIKILGGDVRPIAGCDKPA